MGTVAVAKAIIVKSLSEWYIIPEAEFSIKYDCNAVRSALNRFELIIIG